MTWLSSPPMVVVLLLVVVLCQVGDFVEGVSFEEDVSITFEQKVAIDKLKRRVQPYMTEEYMKEDIYLVRWLRVADFDVSLAERKLIDNMKWRKENKIATIDQEDFSDVAENFPYSNDGLDKEGRPVFIVFVGQWDIRGAVVTGRIPRTFRYLDRALEMLQRRIRGFQQEGKNVTQAILILDLGQFNLVQHACVQCLMRIVEFLQSYESHYPGMADKILIINAIPTVHFVIELARQTVSKETRSAIQVYGTNKEQWQGVLQKYIEKKYLPVEFGGTDTQN